MIQTRVLEIISRAMKKRGVTQLQLADALRCSQTTISQILNGKTRLTVEDLSNIASVLRMQVTEIVSGAEEMPPGLLHLTGELNEAICEDDITFQLFNTLKRPHRYEQLISLFPISNKLNIDSKIEFFRKKGIILEDLEGRLTINTPDAASLHYDITSAYEQRIVDIYKRIRPVVSKIAKSSEKELADWRKKNLDTFYVEYFSEQQIIDQNRYLRNFLEFIKQQLRINYFEKRIKDSGEKYELRSIFISNVPLPSITERI
jgi:transcriptional regulator with XRE-family HTH domain